MQNEALPADAPGMVRPVFKHDTDLPIDAQREEIGAALNRHQVLIVAGETGSGKSTQLPQYCLKFGRGVQGLIAHTQPRRLAARALAARIAEELSQSIGNTVGFRVRFADQVSAATRVVLMTDGLLLAELASDPFLRRYDTIIVDEAHERTLNIDLLLGVLKRLLPRRLDLKLIVTSATLDVERVAQFLGGAPIIAVGGRGHPIEVRYADPCATAESIDAENVTLPTRRRQAAKPPGGAAAGSAGELDLPLAVLRAYRGIAAVSGPVGRGDVLVFLPGEREIRDVGDLLERELGRDSEVLPLYSRLSWDDQRRIFQCGTRPRIVLATNVAETSITVPGIRAVIDSGLARVSRYSPGSRLQRLPIERVSRASAEQRKGRCGRLGPGLCVRLYSEEDFEARAAFTEPEVLRTNLAALLLRLAADGLGAAEEFPFIDAPDSRSLGDGYRLLQELQALDTERRITRHGRAMARLPLDPRLARALLESRRFRAEGEVLAIVAGLSVPDARSGDTEGGSDEQGVPAAFEDGKSEFAALVKLWRAYCKTREGSRRELKRWCRERGLSLPRLSEWEDAYNQIAGRAAEYGIVARRKPATHAGVHRSLLAGFCTMVGVRGEEGVYSGTRGVRFHIFPGSPLKRRKPRWVMAANVVETSRVFARRVAEIEPRWIEAAAQHLLKREYLEPDWDEVREAVVARERVSYLGLVLRADRVVNYGPIAPEDSRMIFAREALVHGRLQRRPEWLLANDDALFTARLMEERLRTRNLLRPPEYFVEFYDRALPRQVSSAATLDHFTRNLTELQRTRLRLRPEDIFALTPQPELLALFPERVALTAPGGSRAADDAALLIVPVEYKFAPGEPRDGATLKVPLLALPTVTRAAVDAALPGLAQPWVEAVLRSLPKDARRSLIPIAAAAASFMEFVGEPSTNAQKLEQWLKEVRGVPGTLVRFDTAAVPAHLKVHLAVIQPAAAADREIAAGSDLAQLRRRCAAAAQAELDRRARQLYPEPWRRFEADEFPAAASLSTGQGILRVYPTLARTAHAAELRYAWSPEEAARGFVQGAVYLARNMLDRQSRDLERNILSDTRMVLAAGPYLQGDALADALLQRIFQRACFHDDAPPHSRAPFEAAVQAGRDHLRAACDAVMASAHRVFDQAREVRRCLDAPWAQSHADLANESRAHLHRLLSGKMSVFNSSHWLRQLPRYIKAELLRWQRLAARGEEPPHILRTLQDWNARTDALDAQVAAELRWLPQLDELHAWVEEYRVSLYAQELRTLGPVSAPRLTARAAAVEQWITR